jgi:hypothetical protein
MRALIESHSVYIAIMRSACNWRRSRRQAEAVQSFSDCIRGMDCHHNAHTAAGPERKLLPVRQEHRPAVRVFSFADNLVSERGRVASVGVHSPKWTSGIWLVDDNVAGYRRSTGGTPVTRK